jgi:uncharacterized protein YbjT (DUF2867 family)
MTMTITGSTGTIGSELLRLLSEAGVPTRAVFRNPAGVQPLPHVAWLQADLSDLRLLEPILAGTTRLFLLSDNTPGFGALQMNVLQAAQELGVAHVVKLSALGASNHSHSTIAREHWEVEQALQRSKMTWTMLRPHAFMQNWLGEIASSVRAYGVIKAAIGDGRVPFIDTRDIAAVAEQALLHPEAHADRKYVLTGGEAVGYADVAAAISEVTGKSVVYQPISMEQARERLEAQSIPSPLIDAMLAIAAYQKAGGPTSTVSDKVELILGRPPRSIRDFVADYRASF